MSINGFGRFLPVCSLVFVLGVPLAANAASACKGLEESVCKGNASCTWVSGYTTKNGNTVSAYCRSSGKQSKQSQNSWEETGKQSAADNHVLKDVDKKVRKLEENNG